MIKMFEKKKGKHEKHVYIIAFNQKEKQERFINITGIVIGKNEIHVHGNALCFRASFDEETHFTIAKLDIKAFCDNLKKFEKSDHDVLVILADKKINSYRLSQKEFDNLYDSYVKNVISQGYYKWLQSQIKRKYVI